MTSCVSHDTAFQLIGEAHVVSVYFILKGYQTSSLINGGVNKSLRAASYETMMRP